MTAILDEFANDRRLFWAIENKDLAQLESACREMANRGENVGMYFKSAQWKTIFSEEEAARIKVYMCGCMDFSPIQHAADIYWLEGIICLAITGIGCQIQGSGLPVLRVNDLMEDYRAGKFAGMHV